MTVEDRKADEEKGRNKIAATDPASLVGPALRPLAERVLDLPPAARSMILHGLVRTAVYQDLGYAERYLSLVTQIRCRRPGSAGTGAADHRSCAPHRPVDVLPGHHPGRHAEDPAGTDGTHPQGGSGRGPPAGAGSRVSPSADRRDHRHHALATGRRTGSFEVVPTARGRADPQGHDPQHEFRHRIHDAEHDGALASAAPALAPFRPGAGGDRGMDRTSPRHGCDATPTSPARSSNVNESSRATAPPTNTATTASRS